MTSLLLDRVHAPFPAGRRRPRPLAAMVLTVGLALSANTAILALVHALLLRQLPFVDAARLVAIDGVRPDGGREAFTLTDYLALRASGHGLQGLAAWSAGSAELDATEALVPLRVQWTTPGFFEVVGARAAVGRLPTAREESGGGERVALLADSLWRSRFGADPAVIGCTVVLDGEPHLVIGVLPGEFLFFTAGAELVVPLDLQNDRRRAQLSSPFVQLVGRLAPGASAAAAVAGLEAKVARLRATDPERDTHPLVIRLTPLANLVVSPVTSDETDLM